MGSWRLRALKNNAGTGVKIIAKLAIYICAQCKKNESEISERAEFKFRPERLLLSVAVAAVVVSSIHPSILLRLAIVYHYSSSRLDKQHRRSSSRDGR